MVGRVVKGEGHPGLVGGGGDRRMWRKRNNRIGELNWEGGGGGWICTSEINWESRFKSGEVA
jgi:hypothetical protein